MAIEEVLYKKDNIIEKINLDDIVDKENYEIVKKNLYCAFNGCDSRMEYVPKGKKIAHFKTWPKENHSSDCIDYFLREKKRQSQKSQATTSIGLTDKHIKRVLKSLTNSINESEEARQTRLKKQREKNRTKKNSITDNSLPPEAGENVRPSTDEQADVMGEGTRAPSVKRRFSIFDLNEDDIGTATALHENIKSINIMANRVIITLQNKGKEVNVYLEESFFASSSRNIDRMLIVVETALENGDSLTLECVGNVEERVGKLCIVLNGQNHLWINKKPIEVFTFNYTNPNRK